MPTSAKIIQVPAELPAMRVADVAHRGSIRAKLVRDCDLPITIPPDCCVPEFKIGRLVSGLREEGLYDIPFMIHRSPESVGTDTDLHGGFVEILLLLQELPYSFRLALPIVRTK